MGDQGSTNTTARAPATDPPQNVGEHGNDEAQNHYGRGAADEAKSGAREPERPHQSEQPLSGSS